LRNLRRRLTEFAGGAGSHSSIRDALTRARESFEAGMNDDLNTSTALAAVHDMRRDINTAMDAGEIGADDRAAALELLGRFNSVLGVLQEEEKPLDPAVIAYIESKIEERNAARRDRDFDKADAIRKEMAGRGIILEDTPQGTKWKVK
jgi:cysteinyl-tRNA synthetase